MFVRDLEWRELSKSAQGIVYLYDICNRSKTCNICEGSYRRESQPSPAWHLRFVSYNFQVDDEAGPFSGNLNSKPAESNTRTTQVLVAKC